MNEYAIFLSFNNQKEVFRIPVNPEEMTITEAGNGDEYKLVAGSMINAIQPQSLTEITFESFFPANAYPFVNEIERLPAPEYVYRIQRWMEKKRPIRFVFSGISYDTSAVKSKMEIAINMPVTIENFEWNVVAGTADIEYSITFKRYNFYAAIQTKIKQKTTTTKKATATKAKARASDKVKPTTYKVKSGDTLWIIAKKVLGDGSKYKSIQTLNGLTDAQTKSLKVGQVLKIPG